MYERAGKIWILSSNSRQLQERKQPSVNARRLHFLKAKTRMRVICTFVPPLVGGEIHDAEGSYGR